ncbi:ATP-binding cassette domain-containing protein [Staphylococcus sp. SQ8-PEA]|uniref:ATP-binding cassette domain-containing protein n=1 Tax=Staphylococcus marylandisciuri TaxID=2981529 RepID=A0ABT2QN43_9STAP|nr:ATP-binding cassette domain-containing protein [Staphylococcus marylandisciuri]MCU5745398.1 ATP-binding cassette domain-containing protein [Staphylococcus marylandisciuri]
MNKLLEIKGLEVATAQGQSLLHHIDLTLSEGQSHVLIGESGSGKSLTAQSLIHALPPGLKADYLSYSFDQQKVTDITSLLGNEIGMITQDYMHSFNSHTKLSKQLIAIYRQHYDVGKSQACQFVTQAVESVELSPDIIDRYRFELSGGQLARVQIASVLMLNPRLIIADEPLASLDVLTGYKLIRLLDYLTRLHGQTLLLITHDLTHASQHSDYVHVMRNGTMVEHLSQDDIKAGQLSDYSAYLFEMRSQLKKDDANDST